MLRILNFILRCWEATESLEEKRRWNGRKTVMRVGECEMIIILFLIIDHFCNGEDDELEAGKMYMNFSYHWSHNTMIQNQLPQYINCDCFKCKLRH